MGFFECHIEANLRNTAILSHMNATGELPFEHYSETEGQYLLTLTTEEIDRLKQHGVRVDRGPDLQRLAKRRRKERAAPRARDDADDTLTTGFVDQYLDAAEVAARIQSLSAEFPALCQLSTLPELSHGYDGSNVALAGATSIQLLRIANNLGDHSRPGFLLICGTHAREWVNPLIAVEFAEQLLRNFNPASADPDVLQVNRIIQEGEVFIVPVMNPDGLNFSAHDDAGWRKNRRPNAGAPACPGVDNNRNYEVYFGGAGSAASVCSDTYRGPSALSEPENRNIRHLLEQFPNILIGVDSHSQGEKIFRPTASGGVAIASLPVFPADEAIYADLEAAAVAAIQSVSGKTYQTGSTSNHSGTSDEYMFFAHRIFGFDVECALSHQPPIATALVSVQEVTAALRALALKAVDLDLEAITPTRIVQCLDRTGSMITFGYEASARANARRFVDLLSIGDHVSAVSFADPSPDPLATPFPDRAVVEFPLTEIDDAGDYASARASIDGIVFGGWTSIGAGLAKSADQLGGLVMPRAIVLISDGFENRQPWVADVLSACPSDVPVHAVALGSLADVPLLQNIATATGGQFYMTPTALELHEIYNQIRTDVFDDDLVLNEVVSGETDDVPTPRGAYVEVGATRLTISLSWEAAREQPKLTLLDPTGREVAPEDWGVLQIRGDGYLLVHIRRPKPGRWWVQSSRIAGDHVLAAFVRSPLRLQIGARTDRIGRRTIGCLLARMELPRPWVARLSGHASLQSVQLFTQDTALAAKRAGLEWIDTLPSQIYLGPRTVASGAEPTCVTQSALLHPLASLSRQKDEDLDRKLKAGGLHQARFAGSLAPGVYSARLRIEGRFADNFHFERAALASLVVPP
jgi:murein tripeptide amidase MpaA